jgi:hypothetical protein
MTETDRAVLTAMEELSMNDYSETPSTWVNERRCFNEGARAAARLWRRHLDSIERHAENARLKRLERFHGVR